MFHRYLVTLSCNCARVRAALFMNKARGSAFPLNTRIANHPDRRKNGSDSRDRVFERKCYLLGSHFYGESCSGPRFSLRFCMQSAMIGCVSVLQESRRDALVRKKRGYYTRKYGKIGSWCSTSEASFFDNTWTHAKTNRWEVKERVPEGERPVLILRRNMLQPLASELTQSRMLKVIVR